MPPVRLIVTALKVAMTASRHPAVRAGLKAAAPIVLNPRNRERAGEALRGTAYAAGVLARKMSGKKPS